MKKYAIMTVASLMLSACTWHVRYDSSGYDYDYDCDITQSEDTVIFEPAEDDQYVPISNSTRYYPDSDYYDDYDNEE